MERGVEGVSRLLNVIGWILQVGGEVGIAIPRSATPAPARHLTCKAT